MPMVKEHVAAAIEARVEKINSEISMWETMIKVCKMDKEQWECKRESVMHDDLSERALRDIYKEATGIIIMGG